ncbi:type VI secretion ATPase, ClpV1 family [compost metagenome]
MDISRQALFGRLNPTLFKAIESATAFCKLRGNPYVELVHWLHQLLQAPDGDLQRILRHAGTDPQALEADLTRALAVLPSGATSISDFAFQIESAIERAWVYATLAFADDRVRGAYLLTALLKTPELRRTVLGISNQFAKVRADDLVDSMPALIAHSPESQEAAYDGSGLAPAVPGEASSALAPARSGKGALGQYCRDLTEEARAGRLDPVIGREHEIRTMTDSGGGAGKATVSDLSFEHFIDRASPNLMKYCLTGKHINEAVLVVRKAGGNPLEYLKLTMTDVLVTKVAPKGSVDDEVRMREKVALSFSKVKQEYVVQNAQGGSGGAVTAGYDIKGNKEA